MTPVIFVRFTVDLLKERTARIDTERSLARTHDDLIKTRTGSSVKERSLSAENECLKFDVVVMTSKSIVYEDLSNTAHCKSWVLSRTSFFYSLLKVVILTLW